MALVISLSFGSLLYVTSCGSLKAGVDTNFLDPLCTWCLGAKAGCSGDTAEPASSQPVTSSAAHRQGSLGGSRGWCLCCANRASWSGGRPAL